jgi:hypothetical protein
MNTIHRMKPHTRIPAFSKIAGSGDESYNDLLCEGGRPCLPLGISLDVSNSNIPEEYRDIVSFWEKVSGNYHFVSGTIKDMGSFL